MYYLVTLCGVYVVVWLCAAFGAIAAMKKRRAMKTWREGGAPYGAVLKEVWFCRLCQQPWREKHHHMKRQHWLALLREPSSRELTLEKKRIMIEHKKNLKWIAEEQAKLASMKKGMKVAMKAKVMKK